jgi:hypothetical protein
MIGYWKEQRDINKIKKQALKSLKKDIEKTLLDKNIPYGEREEIIIKILDNHIKYYDKTAKDYAEVIQIQKDNIQKFNFSIGFPSSGPQGNDNVMRKTMNISNNFNFLQNKQKNKKNKIANSRPSKIDNNNKFRNSMYLKIKKNPNFEYAPKKFLNPKNMRKSINQQQNQSASFNYSFNNSTDNKQNDSTVIKISKKNLMN